MLCFIQILLSDSHTVLSHEDVHLVRKFCRAFSCFSKISPIIRCVPGFLKELTFCHNKLIGFIYFKGSSRTFNQVLSTRVSKLCFRRTTLLTVSATIIAASLFLTPLSALYFFGLLSVHPHVLWLSQASLCSLEASSLRQVLQHGYEPHRICPMPLSMQQKEKKSSQQGLFLYRPHRDGLYAQNISSRIKRGIRVTVITSDLVPSCSHSSGQLIYNNLNSALSAEHMFVTEHSDVQLFLSHSGSSYVNRFLVAFY